MGKPSTTEEILIVTRNFPPLVGGMEKLMEHSVQELGRQYTCTLVGPRGCESALSPPSATRGCRIDPLAFFLLEAFLKTLQNVSRKRFHAVLAGSGVTAPLAGLAKLLFRIPAVSFVHGLDLVAKNHIYQRLFLPWLRRMDVVIANSENTARLATERGISPEKIRVLHPGVKIPSGINVDNRDFLAKHNLLGKKVLLSVGRLVPRKGIAEFIRNAFPRIIEACPETVLLVIGAEPYLSLIKAGGTRQSVKDIATELGLSENVIMLGNVDDETLSAAYDSADLFIFPVLDLPGDVEGFGIVAIEAAAHGLPTIAFASGGVTDAVEDGYSGYLVESGDYRGFAEKAIAYLRTKSTQVTSENCRKFASRFSWDRFGEKLREICASLGND